MTERCRNNWIAVLIVFLLLMLAAALGGCGSVSVQKNADGSYSASSFSLFKDIQEVSLKKTPDGNVDASLGSSLSSEGANALFLVCTINPALPMCQQEQ